MLMANPQIEDGYTKIANELLDALISTNWSGQDFKIALLIIRKTYGFNKCEDAVSLSQMVKATGMIKTRCSQVVNRLQLLKILTVTENINGIGKKYKFNKNFESWVTVTKIINRYTKQQRTVAENSNKPLLKSVTTKERKEKKDSPSFILPDYIPLETWKA
jgi:phage replication O-like protein O